MINEIEEFHAYTGAVTYTARNKHNASYLGRFTYAMLMDFEGMARVFTIVARGYMFGENTEPDIERARRALCAWCSVPDDEKASPREDWQFQTDFSNLHDAFPELVNESGAGWFYRHVHNVLAFVDDNPEKVSKTAKENCAKFRDGFAAKWRGKVVQYQTPIFSESAQYAWILHFDDALADALELGPLRSPEILLSPEMERRITTATPKGVPEEVLRALTAYYLANKPEDSDWVVLPVTNFDAYFGTTSFGRRWLAMLPEDFIHRKQQSFGICRYRLSFAMTTACAAIPTICRSSKWPGTLAPESTGEQ